MIVPAWTVREARVPCRSFAEIAHAGESFRLAGMISHGFKTGNTAYYSAAEPGISLTGRAE